MKTLWTTKAIMEEVQRRYNCINNNQLSKKMGVGPSATLGWSRGAVMEKEEHIRHAALLLDEDAGWLSLCLAVEREKSMLAGEMKSVLLATTNRVALLALGIVPLCFWYLGHLNIT